MTSSSEKGIRNINDPHGLGDPDDTRLRKVELEVLVPQKMRDKAKKEKCTQEVADFEKCCKDSSFLMFATCRDENQKLKDCLGEWYKDEEFRNKCTQEYLNERSEYRRTGLTKKQRAALSN